MITKNLLQEKNIQIVLASASPYKREILSKIVPEFESFSPDVNEDIYKDEKLEVTLLGEKLAILKAKDYKNIQNKIVIGADQICFKDNQIFNKPSTFENAFKQIKSLSGSTHYLHTSVAILFQDTIKTFTDTTILKMKDLTDEQINVYLNLDRPFNSAGSYKIEEHGISLFDSIQMNDYFSIIGLPLIKINQALQEIIHQAN